MRSRVSIRRSLAMLVAATVVACGGPAASGGPAETSGTTEPPASGGPSQTALSGKLTVWSLEFDPHVQGWKNVAEGYMTRNPDVTVVVEPQGGQVDMGAKYKAALASGSGGDVFTVPGPDVYEMALAGNLVPLSPEVMTYDEAKKSLMPEYILQAPVDETLWAIGIPDPPGDAGLVVNVDQLTEAGLKVPARFASRDELLAYAEKLTTRSGDKLTRAGLGFQEANDGVFFLSYIVDQGGTFWDNDAQRFTLQTPEAKAAMQFFVDLFDRDRVDSFDLPNSIDGLLQGTTSMAFMWPEFMPFASGAAPENRYAFVQKPSFGGSQPPVFSHADTWNAVVPTYVANKALATDFIRYLASEEGQLKFLDANPGLSPLRSLVLTNDYYTTGKGAYLAPVIEAMKAGRMRFFGPFLDGSTLVYDNLWATMETILRGDISIDDGLAKIEELMNETVALSRQRLPNAGKTIIYFDALPADLAIK